MWLTSEEDWYKGCEDGKFHHIAIVSHDDGKEIIYVDGKETYESFRDDSPGR